MVWWALWSWMACAPGSPMEGQRYILEWPVGHAVGTAVFSTEGPGRWAQVLEAVGQEGSPGAWMRASVSREGDGWRYEGRWAVGSQRSMRRVVPEGPGWRWTSREGLEVHRTRGTTSAEALVFSSPEPLAALPWHVDPLLWSAMLPLLPADPGGERAVQAMNVVTGRVEPFWIQARGEEGAFTGTSRTPRRTASRSGWIRRGRWLRSRPGWDPNGFVGRASHCRDCWVLT